MPEIIFKYSKAPDGPLVVETGANHIKWSYGLNTQTMPTYGGEVVQILSAYVEDLSIQGDARTYKQMEHIYSWFLDYLTAATQTSFENEPIEVSYPRRGWRWAIRPHGLPGFREATDTVAPTWEIQAAVVETDKDLELFTLEQAAAKGFDFSPVSGGVGYDEDNPFTNAFAAQSDFDPVEFSGKITDWYQNLLPSYLDHDFDPLFKEGFLGSQPTKRSGDDDENQEDQQGGKNDTPSPTTPNAIIGGD